ncbi:MAG: hypothetical protein ACK5WY_08850, partial [Holosporaceae bacterium]
RFHAAQQPAAAPPPAPPIPIFVHPAFPSLLIPSPHQKVILFLGMLILRNYGTDLLQKLELSIFFHLK